MALLVLVSVPPAPAQAPVPLTSGEVIDGPSTVVRRGGGSLELVFERGVLEGGVEVSRGLYRMRSLDAGRTWTEPVPLRDLPGVDEGEPSLIEFEGVLFCYYTSNLSGESKIHVARSVDAEVWDHPPFPLDLGWAPGIPLGHPAASPMPDGGAVLAYENRNGGQVHVTLLPGFLMPIEDRVPVGVGTRPDLLTLGEAFMLVFRPDAGGGALLSLSEDGLAWSPPSPLLEASALQHPALAAGLGASVELLAELRPDGGAGRLQRATSPGASPPDFGTPVDVEAGPDAAQPAAVLDSEAGPLGIYFGQVEADGTVHLARTVACDEPPGVVEGLRVARAAGGVAVSWSETPGTVGALLSLSVDSPPLEETFVDEPGGPLLPPLTLALEEPLVFLRVRAVDACGQEGPSGTGG